MAITSYEVGAVFKIVDQASAPLAKLAEKLASFDKMIVNTQKALSEFGKTKTTGLLTSLGEVEGKFTKIIGKSGETANAIRSNFQRTDTAFVETNRKLEGLGSTFATLDGKSAAASRAVVSSFEKADASINQTIGRTDALIKRLGEAGGAAGQIRLPRSSGGGGGGAAHPRPGQGGASGSSTGEGGHGNTYGRHGAGVDAGIFGFIGFEAAKGAVEGTLHRGMELAHTQEQMRQAGLSEPDIGRATRGAWKEGRTYGLDVSKVLGDIKELVLPFGSVDHAIEFIEPLEKMRVVLNSVTEGRGNENAEAVYKMARAGELKGLQSPEEFISLFQGMTKAISASGGKVTPDAFMQATKYGKLASFGLSEDFYTRSLPTLIQAMGPSTAGTSLMSLFNTLVSGSVSKRALGQMEDLGLVGDYSKIHYDKQGNPVGYAPGAIKGTDELVKNPLEWAKTTLVPLLEKKFGDLGLNAEHPNAENKERAIEGLSGLFGNRNSAAAIAELALRSKSFDRDAGLTDKARGLEGAGKLLANDPTAAMNNFSAAWTNLLTALGGPAVKPATDLITGLAGGMNRLGEFTTSHPEFAKSIEGVLAGLAVGLGALAVVGLAAFLPGGVAIAGMTALTGAIVGFEAVHWDKISGIVLSGLDTMKKIPEAIASVFTSITAKLRAIPGIGHFFAGDASGAIPEARTKDDQYTAPLTDKQKHWWKEGHPGLPGFGLMSYGGAANDNGGPLADAIYSGFMRAFRELSGGGMGGAGGIGGGSGFMNASFETSGEGGGRINVNAIGGEYTDKGSFNDKAPGIMKKLMHDFDIDAPMAAKLMGNLGHESGGLQAFGERGGGSGIGWAQWTGTRNLEFQQWAARHGLDPHSDAANYGMLKHDLQGKYAPVIAALKRGASLEEVEQMYEGARLKAYGSRHAYEKAALDAYRHAPTLSAPRPKVAPGAPASGPIQASAQPPIHVALHVDGKVIARHTVRQVASSLRFPTSMGEADTYGSYVSPGTPLPDVA